jgi:hypothetical protein
MMRKKRMRVNGVEFESIREAARFIVKDASRATADTVVKELRSLWRGRAAWLMYDKYLVEKCDE